MLTHMGNGISYFNGDREMTEIMKEMMWPYRTGLGRTFWGFHWILELTTWLLIIGLLIGLVRWVWRKGDKLK